jgi:hypothetical protein
MIPPDWQPFLDRAYAPAAFALITAGIVLAMAARDFSRRLIGLGVAQAGAVAFLAMADAAGAPHARSATIAFTALSACTLAIGVALLLRAPPPSLPHPTKSDPPR